jgi:hypothetical protein
VFVIPSGNPQNDGDDHGTHQPRIYGVDLIADGEEVESSVPKDHWIQVGVGLLVQLPQEQQTKYQPDNPTNGPKPTHDAQIFVVKEDGEMSRCPDEGDVQGGNPRRESFGLR